MNNLCCCDGDDEDVKYAKTLLPTFALKQFSPNACREKQYWMLKEAQRLRKECYPQKICTTICCAHVMVKM